MDKDTLVIVWTSGDVDVAKNMVFMYMEGAINNRWWENIKFIVWGPSAKLLSESEQLQEKIKEFINQDVTVEACKACADRYDVSDHLATLGVDVKFMGEPLTDYIKSNNKVITF